MAPTGIIFDIKKYAIHDGPGIRTTVFFKGCPLNCWWCHNPEGLNEKQETLCVKNHIGGPGGAVAKKKVIFGRIVTVDQVMSEIARDIIFYDQSGGGATFSGGEPLMQPEFLRSLLIMCKCRGISTAVDTSGHAPTEVFEQIYGLVDLFLYDLKIMDDEKHKKYTGVSNRQILDNLIMLSKKGNKTRLRLPMIPGITDAEENLGAILDFIKPLSGIRDIALLPYNRLAEDKLDRFNLPNQLGKLPTISDTELDAIVRLFGNHGYRVKVGG